MAVKIICLSLLCGIGIFLAFWSGRMWGFHKKEEAEKDRALERYLHERKARAFYCLHCEHGLVRTIEGARGTRIERVVCELEAECDRFKRGAPKGRGTGPSLRSE